jgi:thiamine biosynthesis protein ThiS
MEIGWGAANVSSPMKFQINGAERELDTSADPFTLGALVEMLGMKSDRVAVELNREIVPRDRWAETRLKNGDQLEIVHFVGGGSAGILSVRD